MQLLCFDILPIQVYNNTPARSTIHCKSWRHVRAHTPEVEEDRELLIRRSDCRRLRHHNNTLRNWASIDDRCRRRVRPILYVENLTTSTVGRDGDALVTWAVGLGWSVLEVPRLSRIGLPFIKDMYLDVARRYPDCLFYAYANGDILFDRGLTDTLLAVAEVNMSPVA